MIERDQRASRVSGWGAWVDRWIPSRLRAPVDVQRRARVLVIVALAMIPVAVMRGVGFVFQGLPREAIAPVVVVLFLAAALVALRRFESLRVAGNLICLGFYTAGIVFAYVRGDHGANMMVALGAVPLFAMFVAGIRWGLVWGGINIVATVGWGALVGDGLLRIDRFPVGSRAGIETLAAVLFTAILLALGVAYESTKDAALREVSAAQRQQVIYETEARLLRTDRLVTVGLLAANVAHEVNNPLQSLMVNVEEARRVLTEDGEEGDAAALADEALADASLAVEQIRDVVSELKTYARVDDSDEQDVPVGVDTVLETALKMANPRLRYVAEVDASWEPDLVTLARPARLTQVFLNLLFNAADAMVEKEDGPHTVTVRAVATDAEWLRVTVRDTGIGMTPQAKARAMEPFFTTKPVTVGTGLGLSVCQRIVETVGGHIDIDSVRGEGTTMTVVLPRVAARPAAVRTSPPAHPAHATRLRVLVIDDDNLLRRALRLALESYQYDVVLADSGPSALDCLSSDARYDAVICDLMMPGMTGQQTYQAINRRWPDLGRRIIFLTGGATNAPMREFVTSIAAPVINKPVEPDDLFGAVERVARSQGGSVAAQRQV